MGLDIYHTKAILQPLTRRPYLAESITETTYAGFNVPFGHFGKYIQQVAVADNVHTCILVKSEKDLEYVREWFSEVPFSYTVLYEKDLRVLVKTLHMLEAELHLNRLHRHLEDGPPQWNIVNYYTTRQETGFYTHTEGYQRKGMNHHFSERFYHDDIFRFALKEDFAYAHHCVDYYWDNDSAEDVFYRRQQFKHDFVDKFEDGASFMHVSY